MTRRLTSSSLAGTSRKLVAVGTPRLASMFWTMRAAAPLRGSPSGSVTAAAGAAAGAAVTRAAEGGATEGTGAAGGAVGTGARLRAVVAVAPLVARLDGVAAPASGGVVVPGAVGATWSTSRR